MDERTTRQRIAAALREASGLTPAELSGRFDDPTVHEGYVLAQIDHVRQSTGDDERLLVAPPACRDCGFDDFDDPAGGPSNCPNCRSRNLSAPVFTIRPVE